MKSIVASILGVCFAVLIGSFFLEQSGEVERTVVKEVGNVKAFQLGAYKVKDSALEMTKKTGGVIINDNDYYYVYYAVLSDTKNIERMTNYLNNKNIYYYIKDINTNDIFSNELLRYEDLMKNTTTDIAFIEINKQIVNLYGETYEN